MDYLAQQLRYVSHIIAPIEMMDRGKAGSRNGWEDR